MAWFSVPASLRHPVALLGAAVTTVAALLFFALLLLEALGVFTSPYFGLLLFVTIPAAFVVGLLLIPVGVRLDARRRRRFPGAPPADWPVLDLTIPRQRRIIGGVLLLTVVNLVLLSMASVGAVHYMETTEFCGRVCHTTMEPQYVAHQTGPHARVPCVDCHVGPGAGALIESKMAGTRQLLQIAMNRVPTPVPSPVQTMRPARFTCENCHWPEKFHGDELRIFREYADDEPSTETATVMTMFVGGGNAALGIGTGIHWHMNLANEIEYVTTDPARQVIPYVKLRTRDGTVREYTAPNVTAEQIASGERRRMDCLDCHSRPAHTLFATPERAIDTAIAQGRIPRDLPFVRREAVAAVRAEYADKDAAVRAIASRLREFYKNRPASDADLVSRIVTGTQDVWLRNVFPAMKVTWGTYPNHISHIDTPGCFRCHDDEHVTKDGRAIKQDCEMCHKEQEQPQ
ncbi:MAG TPA: NapC/NirT family cytochrome c [Vicinamibacterales bacterium]